MRYNRIAVLFITCSFHYCTLSAQNAPLRLQVVGDSVRGFQVNIYEGNRLRVTRQEEFSLEMFNQDLSIRADLPSWKGKSWTGNDTTVELSNETYIERFDASLQVRVRYEVLNRVVKKTIRLFQPSMPDLYYILREKDLAPEQPLKYVSFEYDSFPGGFVHEMYPAVAWVTADHQTVGFLTDAGYLNQYSRATRRRFSGRGGGLTGIRRLPDPELFVLPTTDERNSGRAFVQQTYGEMYNLDAGVSQKLILAPFIPGTNTTIQNKDSILTITGKGGTGQGLSFISPMKDQHIYTIYFRCRGTAPIALKFFRIKNGAPTVELENGLKYIDAFPVSDSAWTIFKGSVMVPYIAGDSVNIFLGTGSLQPSVIQVKDFRLEQNLPAHEPYNILPLGKEVTKTSFVFIEPWHSQKDFMISAQTRLAEGKAFRGTQIEKMMYANFNMLTWVTSVSDFTPFNVPNMNYMPDMYNRDCFFAAVSTYNRALNLSLWNQWAKTQTTKGAIGTIITPLMGSVEAKDNEASIEWLIWAMLNKRRFGYMPPNDKIKKTVDYILNEFDSTGGGICYSHFPLCQVDIIDFNPKTNRLAVNQGMLAIALRTMRELGFPVSDEHLEKAEQAYRNFYDASRKHLLYDRNYPDLICLSDLEPEFFSIWLFNRPILTDEIVQNELNLIPALNKSSGSPHPEMGTTAPVLIRLIKEKPGYAFLSKNYQPFEKFGADNYSDGKNDGYYYNGGSWLRPEYCAYVAGMKHGWEPARARMENRVWAEINLNPKWPFSKEFIPTKWQSTDSWWPSTRGLCWNVFILMADEVAGIRTPEMDPDYNTN